MKLNSGFAEENAFFVAVVDDQELYYNFTAEATLNSTGETLPLEFSGTAGIALTDFTVSFTIYEVADTITITDNLGNTNSFRIYGRIGYGTSASFSTVSTNFLSVAADEYYLALAETGAVYLHTLLPTTYTADATAVITADSMGSTGSLTVTADSFGASLALSGDLLVIAAPLLDCPYSIGCYESMKDAYDDCEVRCTPGTVCYGTCADEYTALVAECACTLSYTDEVGGLFVYNVSGVGSSTLSTADRLQLIYKVGVPDATNFGSLVALDGDTLLVADAAGTVYYYHYNGYKFVLRQEMTVAHMASAAWLAANGPVLDFGAAISVSGGVAVIGATDHAFILERVGSVFVCSKIIINDSGSSETYSVLHTNGVDVFLPQGTAVSVFQRDSFGWFKEGETSYARHDNLGTTIDVSGAISISSAGRQVAIADSANVYLYSRPYHQKEYLYSGIFTPTVPPEQVASAPFFFIASQSSTATLFGIGPSDPADCTLYRTSDAWAINSDCTNMQGSTTAHGGRCANVIYQNTLGTTFATKAFPTDPFEDPVNAWCQSQVRADFHSRVPTLTYKLGDPTTVSLTTAGQTVGATTSLIVDFPEEYTGVENLCARYELGACATPVSVSTTVVGFELVPTRAGTLSVDFRGYTVQSFPRSVVVAEGTATNFIVFPNATRDSDSKLRVDIGTINENMVPLLDCAPSCISVLMDTVDAADCVRVERCFTGQGIYHHRFAAADINGFHRYQGWRVDSSGDLTGDLMPFNLTLSEFDMIPPFIIGDTVSLLVGLYDKDANLIVDYQDPREVKVGWNHDDMAAMVYVE